MSAVDLSKSLEELLRAFHATWQAARSIQTQEDAHTRDALNGYEFVNRLLLVDPWLRAGLAEMSTHQGLQCHKLSILERITRYAAGAMQRRFSAMAYSGLLSAAEGESLQATAQRYFRSALLLDQKCALAHYNLAVLLEEFGDPQEAIAHFDRASESQSYYQPFADFHVAKIHERLGDRVKAQDRWRRVRSSGVMLGEFHGQLAERLREAGEIEVALTEFGRTLDCVHYRMPEFVMLDIPIEDREASWGKLRLEIPPPPVEPPPDQRALVRRLVALARRVVARVRRP